MFGDKVPFVVSAFVACAAWVAVHTTDRLLSAPFLEYELSESTGGPTAKLIELRFRNIGGLTKFDCFDVTIVPALGGHAGFAFGGAKDQEQQLRGTVLAKIIVTRADSREWKVRVSNVLPGADISLSMPVNDFVRLAILAQPCLGPLNDVGPAQAKSGADDVFKSASVPILVERGLLTRFVEHEISVLWVMLSLWFLFIVITIAKRPESGADNAANE